ncbi:globin domain containing protein [Nitzschia inconspicua]|nr:globin domain containing protein [Nitzschia inconspicua]
MDIINIASYSPSNISIIGFEAVVDVTSSWGKIVGSPELETKFADGFFRNIIECVFFAKHPIHGGSGTRSSKSNAHDRSASNPLFKIKSQVFVRMLSVAMDMLGPDLEPMQEVLTDLGAQHLDYGVMEGDYDLIGEALMMTLKEHLKDQWTDRVQQSWRDVYIFIACTMMEGSRKEESYRKRGVGKREIRRMSIPPRYRKLDLDNDAIATTLKGEAKGLLGMLDKALTITNN